MITPAVEEIADKLLGIDITTRGLRLLPYIQHCILNAIIMDKETISKEEEDILDDWVVVGYIRVEKGRLKCSKTFWDASCEILWEAYANYED